MVDGIQERIMEEAHNSIYSIHLVSKKMYHDLRDVYWWNGMNKDMLNFWQVFEFLASESGIPKAWWFGAEYQTSIMEVGDD